MLLVDDAPAVEVRAVEYQVVGTGLHVCLITTPSGWVAVHHPPVQYAGQLVGNRTEDLATLLGAVTWRCAQDERIPGQDGTR